MGASVLRARGHCRKRLPSQTCACGWLVALLLAALPAGVAAGQCPQSCSSARRGDVCQSDADCKFGSRTCACDMAVQTGLCGGASDMFCRRDIASGKQCFSDGDCGFGSNAAACKCQFPPPTTGPTGAPTRLGDTRSPTTRAPTPVPAPTRRPTRAFGSSPTRSDDDASFSFGLVMLSIVGGLLGCVLCVWVLCKLCFCHAEKARRRRLGLPSNATEAECQAVERVRRREVLGLPQDATDLQCRIKEMNMRQWSNGAIPQQIPETATDADCDAAAARDYYSLPRDASDAALYAAKEQVKAENRAKFAQSDAEREAAWDLRRASELKRREEEQARDMAAIRAQGERDLEWNERKWATRDESREEDKERRLRQDARATAEKDERHEMAEQLRSEQAALMASWTPEQSLPGAPPRAEVAAVTAGAASGGYNFPEQSVPGAPPRAEVAAVTAGAASGGYNFMRNDDRVLGEYHQHRGGLFYKGKQILGGITDVEQLDDGHAKTQGRVFFHGKEIEGLTPYEAQDFKTFGAGYSGACGKLLYMGEVLEDFGTATAGMTNLGSGLMSSHCGERSATYYFRGEKMGKEAARVRFPKLVTGITSDDEQAAAAAAAGGGGGGGGYNFMRNDDRILGEYHENVNGLFYKGERISGNGCGTLKQLDDGYAKIQGHMFFHGKEIEGVRQAGWNSFETYGAGYAGAGSKLIYMGEVLEDFGTAMVGMTNLGNGLMRSHCGERSTTFYFRGEKMGYEAARIRYPKVNLTNLTQEQAAAAAAAPAYNFMRNDDRMLGEYHQHGGGLFYKGKQILGGITDMEQLDDGHAKGAAHGAQGRVFFHGKEIEGLTPYETQGFKTFGAGYSGAYGKMLYMGEVIGNFGDVVEMTDLGSGLMRSHCGERSATFYFRGEKMDYEAARIRFPHVSGIKP